jgi:hypothetical protein
MNNYPTHKSTPDHKPFPGERARHIVSLPPIGLILLSALFLLAIPVQGAPLVSNPNPGDQWTIERLPESDRTPLPDTEQKTRPKEKPAKGTPLERNRLGNDFREQAALDPDGNILSLRILTGEFVIERLEGGKDFAIDTLSHTMPGGRPVWNRPTEFQWVNGKNLRGYASVDGVECRIHMERPEDSPKRPPRLAAISTADGKPIRLETPTEIRRYVWDRATIPQMPDQARRVLEEFRLEAKRQIQRHNVPR